MACVNYNCTDEFGAQTLVDCEEYPLGGITSLLLLLCGHTLTDPTSESAIQTEIDNGTAVLVKNIKGNLPAASPILVTPPVGCSTDKVSNYDRTLIWQDGNINQANLDNIYDPLGKGTPIDSVLWYECAEDRTTWSRPDKIMRGQVTRVVPDSDTEFQVLEATLTWRSITNGTLHAAAPNIFT